MVGNAEPSARGTVPLRAGAEQPPALRYDQRPVDDTPVHTADLPGAPVAEYKRRIGPWLLWRAGPASGGDARYWAALAADTGHAFTLRLFPDGRAEGTGPSGSVHDRFRAWKEDLRDHDR